MIVVPAREAGALPRQAFAQRPRQRHRCVLARHQIVLQMTRIAHITDPHILEDGFERRSAASLARLIFLSFSRPLQPALRRRRLLRALTAARQAAADHIVITGDLTEDGAPVQFESLAATLAESRVDASRVTLLAGNHDGYTDPAAFTRALQGPLRQYAATSQDGAIIRLAGLALLVVSASIRQNALRSAGRITAKHVQAAHRLQQERGARGRALAVAVHHPPTRHPMPWGQWWDGLMGHKPLLELLHAHESAHVLHGHIHRRHDRRLHPSREPQIFSAEAVVDGGEPMRMYDVTHARLSPVPQENPMAAVLPQQAPV